MLPRLLICGFLMQLAGALPAAESSALDQLIAAYRTEPSDYSGGAAGARPDPTVCFRWNNFNASVDRHADARMTMLSENYNPVEGDGVSVGDGGKLSFVAEHATAGKLAAKVEITAAMFKDWNSWVKIDGHGGPRLPKTNATPACFAAEYWPHYRRLRMDVFNAEAGDLHVRILDVPFILHPGANDVVVRVPDVGGTRIAMDGVVPSVTLAVAEPVQNATLFLDNVRMETEVPALIAERGRLFQLTSRAITHCQPGFTPVNEGDAYTPERKFGWTAAAILSGGDSAQYHVDNSLLKYAYTCAAPLRIDLPDGSYGIHIVARAGDRYDWRAGARMKVNGVEQVLVDPRSQSESAAAATATDLFDYRPGLSLFASRMRAVYFPITNLLQGEAKDGCLTLVLPEKMLVSGILIFPMADQDEARKEIGRLEYLLAESWELTRPWLRERKLKRTNYVGLHDEILKPETIPARLQALNPSAADFQRGIITFVRGLSEAVYPDTVPSPEEAAVRELRALAAPGQRECVSLGLLPLAERKGIAVAADDLLGPDGARIPASAVDLRFSRYQQKYTVFRRHNTVDYNYQEHYLGHRAALDLQPANARRLYLDIAVPAGAKAGTYRGRIVLSADGAELAAMPLVLEVVPIALAELPIYLGTSFADPLLAEFGLNNQPGIGGHAADPPKHGFAQPLTPGELAKFAPLGGMDATTLAAAAGKDFWIVDATQNSKEQFARFTFGIWLWRSGASGRFTVLGDYAIGDIIHPRDRAIFCVSDTEAWYSRDLLLVREGIDDYRYIVTLQDLVRRADKASAATPALAAAKQLLDDLRSQVALDLTTYYEIVPGGYMENKYALPENPWVGAKFDALRRAVAERILALAAEVGR